MAPFIPKISVLKVLPSGTASSHQPKTTPALAVHDHQDQVVKAEVRGDLIQFLSELEHRTSLPVCNRSMSLTQSVSPRDEKMTPQKNACLPHVMKHKHLFVLLDSRMVALELDGGRLEHARADMPYGPKRKVLWN